MGSLKINTIIQIAIIIPCFNEESAIAQVIHDYKNALPQAKIYVFDNNSTDATAQIAIKNEAIVHYVKKQGKGNVVKAMFRDIDADYYIMIDGDGTYSAHNISVLLETVITNRVDMLIGNRLVQYENSASRKGHLTGNKIITQTVNFLFKSDFIDLLSGYRILSRRFVKSVPLFYEGFEVETALAIHAIEVDAKIVETPINYLERANGSVSKLNTFKDGIKIGLTIFSLFKDYHPRLVFGTIGGLFSILGLLIGLPVIIEFIDTGLVLRFPSAILASGLIILSFLSIFSGLILSSIAKNRKIIKKLSFLNTK